MAEVRPWHRSRENSVSPFKQSFAKLIEHGYSPLPIKAGTKRPAIKEWSDYCGVQPDSETLAEWVRSFPVAGLGVACGYHGLVGSDIDTTNPDIVAAIEDTLCLHGPLSPFGKIGKKGKTLFYNAGAGIHSRKFLDKDKKVIFEILADGCQTIIPPTIHPETGQPYQWLNADFTLFDTHVSELPTIGEGLASELEMALKPWLAVEKDFPELKARDPTKALGDLERRRLLGFAEVKLEERCKELGGMSASSGRNWEAFRIASAMGAFGHHGIVALPQIEAAILDACATNGLVGDDGRRAVVATIRSGLNAARNDPLRELADRDQDGGAGAESVRNLLKLPSTKANDGNLDDFIYNEDFNASIPPELIKHLLPRNGVVIDGGQSGVGKTYMEIDMAVALASKQEWFGQPVRERVGVVYIAAEGEAVVQRRFIAARRHRKLEGQPLPLALYRRNDIDIRDVKKRAAMIGRLINLNNIFLERYDARLGCVILDTVSASCPMKDENSNAEIADIARALREFDEILDAVIIGVHHFGKNADSGLRGGSGWRANCDHSRIFLGDRDGPESPVRNRRMVLEKNRLGVEGDVFGFDLGVMSFGKDIYGDEATECHVTPAIYKKQTVISEVESSFHKAFVGAAMGYQHPAGQERLHFQAVPLLNVRDAFVAAWVTGEESMTKDESSAKRVAWHRALKKAREGAFSFEKTEVEEWVWPHA